MTFNFSWYLENNLTIYTVALWLTVGLTYLVLAYRTHLSLPKDTLSVLFILFCAYAASTAFLANEYSFRVFFKKEVVLYVSCILLFLFTYQAMTTNPRLVGQLSFALFYVSPILLIDFWWREIIQGHYGPDGLMMTRHYLSMYCVLVLFSYCQFFTLKSWLPLTIVAGMLLTIIFSNSRAVYLASIIAIGTVVFLRYKHYIKWYYIVLSVLGIVGIAYLLYHIRPLSANGRLILWDTVWTVTDKATWILGNGVGYIENKILLLQAYYFMNQPLEIGLYGGAVKTVLNEYFTLLIEVGLVGIILFLLLTAYLIMILFKERKYYLIGGIMGLAVFGFFSNPSFSFTLVMFIVILIAYAAGALKKGMILPHSASPVVILFSALFMLCNAVYIHFFKVWYDKKDVPISTDADLSGYTKWPSVMGDNPYFLNDYGIRLLAMDRIEEADSVLAKAVSLRADVSNYLAYGQVMEARGKLTEAERNYRIAIAMQPKLFVPKYILFDMFRSHGLTEKAQQFAIEIKDYPVKIDNAEVREIKTAVDTYLKQNNYETQKKPE